MHEDETEYMDLFQRIRGTLRRVLEPCLLLSVDMPVPRQRTGKEKSVVAK